MSRKLFLVLPIVVTILLALGAVLPAQGQASPPSYQLQYLGPGSPVSSNNSGVVVGRKLLGSTSNYEPLVSVNGAAWVTLPVPAGAMSVFPTDVNDNGIIVGVSFAANWNPVAVLWRPVNGGYTIEEIPRLSGDASSYATGINNLGQIIGARRTLGYAPTGSGWQYSDQLGVVDLVARYGWWTWPTKINDMGQVVGGAERLDLNTGVVEWVGNGPSNYNAVTAVDINNRGQMAGAASLRSTSLNIVSVFRYEGAAGWQYIDGTSRYAFASNINNLGDICYGELGTGLYLDGLGKYPLWQLLDPAVINAGWATSGSGCFINDQRQVVTSATNSVTGQSGGVLLTPVGPLPPPTAPANLQGVARAATAGRPWNSIDLTWENTSPLTQGYELERSETGAGVWTRLTLTPPGRATNHSDTTVNAGVTYQYRVRAIGVGGASPWSNEISVNAPVTPVDTIPPTVTILTPANGAHVSGSVTISAQATDNVGVEYLEISFWNQYTGQQVILGSVAQAGALSVNWDTRGLTPATYTVRAYAYDALNNWTQTEISVNVSASVKSLRVSDISLSGTVSGSRVYITGNVYVRDNSNRAVSNASVTIRWTLPNGSTRTSTAVTGSTGRAKFTLAGTRGTYTLAVTNVAKSDYVFDSANSVLSKSITK